MIRESNQLNHDGQRQNSCKISDSIKTALTHQLICQRIGSTVYHWRDVCQLVRHNGWRSNAALATVTVTVRIQ